MAKITYPLYINDTLFLAPSQYMKPETIYRLAGEEPPEEGGPSLKLYSVSSDNSVDTLRETPKRKPDYIVYKRDAGMFGGDGLSKVYGDIITLKARPDIGDVYASEFKPPSFFTKAYMDKAVSWAPITADSEPEEPKLSLEDRKVLASLGVEW